MRAIAAAVLAPLLGSQAMAEDGSLPTLSDPATLKECGACHIAFQPQLLPMRCWQAIMGHLDSHFGEDVSLPETTRGAIERYLVAHAGDAPGAAGGSVISAASPRMPCPCASPRRHSGAVLTKRFPRRVLPAAGSRRDPIAPPATRPRRPDNMAKWNESSRPQAVMIRACQSRRWPSPSHGKRK